MLGNMEPCEERPSFGCKEIPNGIPCELSVSPVKEFKSIGTSVPKPTCLPHQKRLSNPTTYYNVARKGLYDRFTVCDWDKSFGALVGLSQKVRQTSERIRVDADTTAHVAARQARSRQCSNTKKLGDRMYDVSFWKNEMVKEINAMEAEVRNVIESIRIANRSVEEMGCVLEISEESLRQREKRLGIDLVFDAVEKCLTKEVTLLRNSIATMNKIIDQLNMQQQLLRNMQHRLDVDVRDKHHAENIDDRMHHMHNSTHGIGYFPDIEYEDNTKSTTCTWLNWNRQLLARSVKERECSQAMRAKFQLTLSAVSNKIWHQVNSTNHALNLRIMEGVDAKQQLQDQLYKNVVAVRDMERNVDLLRKTIAEKERFLKVAQTRLEERTRRVSVERTLDAPMIGLQTEADELRRAIALLNEKLHKSQLGLCRLVSLRTALENDIAVKENSVQLDDGCVLSMRKKLALDPKYASIFNLSPSDCTVDAKGTAC